jgi:hypothetical protein
MKNFKVMRARKRDSLPALGYGEIAYIDNTSLMVGTSQSEDFVVNDYKNLLNVPDDASVSSAIAGEDIVEGTVVYVNAAPAAFKASSQTPALSRAVGVAISNALTSETLYMRVAGEMVLPSWGFIPGKPVYLAGTSGGLTQDYGSIPYDEMQTLIGIALNETTLLVAIQQDRGTRVVKPDALNGTISMDEGRVYIPGYKQASIPLHLSGEIDVIATSNVERVQWMVSIRKGTTATYSTTISAAVLGDQVSMMEFGMLSIGEDIEPVFEVVSAGGALRLSCTCVEAMSVKYVRKVVG